LFTLINFHTFGTYTLQEIRNWKTRFVQLHSFVKPGHNFTDVFTFATANTLPPRKIVALDPIHVLSEINARPVTAHHSHNRPQPSRICGHSNNLSATTRPTRHRYV